MNWQQILQKLKLFLSPLKDPRYFQIIFLGAFLCYGIATLGWQTEWLKYATIIGACLFVQALGILLLKLPIASLRSALISSLGLCMLLKSDGYWVLALAAFLAITSKFLIRYKGKHLFNPANFGIVASILLTGQTWISPGQWGSDIVLLAFFGAAGFMILFRISRLETGITYFLVYTLLLIFWHVLYLGWGIEVVMHKITNGSLLLFTFFMITDPMTIPNDKRSRIVWATLIAVASFVLATFYQIYASGIWVLFFFTPITILFDALRPSIKFEWIKSPKYKTYLSPNN